MNYTTGAKSSKVQEWISQRANNPGGEWKRGWTSQEANQPGTWFKWEANSIPTDVVPTNAITTKIHVERHIITLYIDIHQGAIILRVM